MFFCKCKCGPTFNDAIHHIQDEQTNDSISILKHVNVGSEIKYRGFHFNVDANDIKNDTELLINEDEMKLSLKQSLDHASSNSELSRQN